MLNLLASAEQELWSSIPSTLTEIFNLYNSVI